MEGDTPALIIANSSVAGGDALADLANGRVPAIVLRGAVAPGRCRRVLRSMCQQGLYTEEWLPLLDEGSRAALPVGVSLAPPCDWGAADRDGWRLDHPMADLGGWGAGGTRTNSGHPPTKRGYFDWVADTHCEEMWAALGCDTIMEEMCRHLGALSGGRQRAARACDEGGQPYG